MPLNPIYPRDREMGGFRWSSELFNQKIDTTAGAGNCWGWTGSMGPQGPLFGARKVQPDGTDRAQMTQARRILYAEYTSTALQPHQSVYHSCGNPNCMFPGHLTLIRPKPKQAWRTIRTEPQLKPPAKPRGRPPGKVVKALAKKTYTGDAN